MKNLFKFIILTLTLFLSCFTLDIKAQELNTKNTLKLSADKIQQKAKIADMSWLAGDWVGEGFGNYSQEVWNKPIAHTMMGMFQMANKGKVVFYEIIHIVEYKGSLLMQLKHFNNDLKGWETKDETVDFPLIKIQGQKAWFSGMTYERKGDQLFVWVAMKQKDDTLEEVEFIFKLVRDL